MIVSSFDLPQPLLEKAPVFACDTAAQILVLETIGENSGLKPILRDGPCQLIGRDVECLRQLADTGMQSRRAIIRQRAEPLVVKAGDPQTWLNRAPVAESPLCDGDLLEIGLNEFRVRGATTDELLQNLPGTASDFHVVGAPKSAARLTLRRVRLSAIRTRLKERRAELEREFERLRTERAQFEVERVEFTHKHLTAGIAALKTTSAPASGSPDDSPTDADRMNRLFQKPPCAASGTALPPATVVLTQPATSDKKKASEHSGTTDSVDDYMQHLLVRIRRRRTVGAAVAAIHEEGRSHTPAATGNDAVHAPGSDAGVGTPDSDPQLTQKPRQAKSQRRLSANQIRAENESFREVANTSARTAIANSALRKLRRSVAITLPLAILPFVIAGMWIYLGIGEAKYFWQAFNTVMLGVIVLIRLALTVWKVRNFDLRLVQSVSEGARRELPSDPINGASDLSSLEAK